jgi:hypothetical protein
VAGCGNRGKPLVVSRPRRRWRLPPDGVVEVCHYRPLPFSPSRSQVKTFGLAGLRRCFGAAFLLGGVVLGRVGFLGVFWRVRGGGYSKGLPWSGVGLLGRSCSSALRRHPLGCRLLDDALAWARGEGLPSASATWYGWHLSQSLQAPTFPLPFLVLLLWCSSF